ncbi:MAG TPA: hypothetical protein VF050_03400 [Moraxellaceae bacterium]
MPLAKLLKGLLIAVGLAFAAVIGIYVLLLVVNLHDEPASGLVKSLQAETARETPVADKENAWVYVMGFNTARHEAPDDAGALRAAWMRQSLRSIEALDTDKDPGAETPALFPAAGPDSELLNACSRSDTDCLLAINASPAAWGELLAKNRWIIQRYEALLEHGAWQEASPYDVLAPLPPLADVFNAQKLYCLQAISAAFPSSGISEIFARDARFWMMVSLHSDTLLTRMIATKALERNLRFLNLVARSHVDIQAETVRPGIWKMPLTPSYFSMRHVLKGEWRFADRLSWQMKAGDEGLQLTDDWGDRDWTSYSLSFLQRPLLQPQYSSNQQAELLMQLANILDASQENYADVMAEAKALESAKLKQMYAPRLYNIALPMAPHDREPQFYSYGARVLDIEGIRRGVIAIIDLRQAGTRPANIGTALAAHPLITSYKNGRYHWDAEHGVLVFQGMAEDAKKTYELVY